MFILTQMATDTKKMLVESGTALIPKLRDLSLEIDRNSELSDEVIEELRSNGLLKVLRPEIFGGYQTNMRTYTEVVT